MNAPGCDLIAVRLVAEAGAIRPDRPLPLRVAVANRGCEPLRKATAELTVEAEKGVLLTWDLELVDLDPGGTCDDALRAVSPPWQLPLNVAPGPARLHLVVRDADGAWLAEDHLELVIGDQAQDAHG